jgi:hypothetical protein
MLAVEVGTASAPTICSAPLTKYHPFVPAPPATRSTTGAGPVRSMTVRWSGWYCNPGGPDDRLG